MPANEKPSMGVPQTMKKAESDVEQLATQKNHLQAGTEHMDPLKQLPLPPTYGATQLDQGGSGLGQCVCPHSICQFHRKEIL